MFKYLYQRVLKPIFFKVDPELVHDSITVLGALLGATWLGRKIIKSLWYFESPALEQEIAGIRFKNPVGLAAGFDKNAHLMKILPQVGFGFEELGSVTGEACKGNSKTRLWRLPKSKSLVVNYGLKNDGAEAISKRLQGKKFEFPLGISAAKTNSPSTVETKDGINDYLKVINSFKGIGDYYTINLSCPNAFGGQPFCEPVKLKDLLEAVKPKGLDKPTFIKVSPDITQKDLDQMIDLCLEYGVVGVICSNLTKVRDSKNILDSKVPEKGGLSGKLVEELAELQIKRVYQRSKGKLVVIGLGGIFNAEDAYRKIRLGASLVQLITGMIFEGPQLIGQINRGLVELLKADGYQNISEAIGVDNPF